MIGDRYRPIEQVGAGGMAMVWKAEDTLLGRFVAIKRLLPHLAGDQAAAERFAREARAAAMLQHPGIVTVFDTGEDADGPYIVLELVTGQTMSDYLARSGPMTASDVAGLVTQVAAALDHAHSAGVIHRDIKPGNLILEPDGRVRLADFGIARTVDDQSTITESGQLVGTISYLAPEILTGDPATPASDIYSLGAVTFELLTGRAPFEADTPAALLEAVRIGGVPDLDGVAPEHMSVAVHAAMARDPDARPQTAQAFAAALTGSSTLVMAAAPSSASTVVASEEPTVVRPAPPPAPPPPAPPASPQRSRRKSVAWPILLLLLTILALSVAALWNNARGGQTADTTTPGNQPSTVATTPAPTTTLPPTTTLAPTTTVPPTTTPPAPTPESVAGEIGLLLASLEPPVFKNRDVHQIEDRVETALEEWQAQDREDLQRELEGAFSEAADLEDSPEKTLLVERLTQLAELMGFRVDQIGDGGGNGEGNGNGGNGDGNG